MEHMLIVIMIMLHIGEDGFFWNNIFSIWLIYSLNIEKRHRDESKHKNEVERLQKQISQTRTNYPIQEFQHDFDKQQDFKRRISRFAPNNK